MSSFGMNDTHKIIAPFGYLIEVRTVPSHSARGMNDTHKIIAPFGYLIEVRTAVPPVEDKGGKGK